MALRWLLDVGPLWNSVDDFASALALIPQPDSRASIQRYHRLPDRKLALASQLLQRLCVSTLSPSHLKFTNVVLAREDNIKGAKPVSADGSVHFNISHHGTIVACAARLSEGGKLGVDVVDVNVPDYARGDVTGWINGFGGEEGGVFTDAEMRLITLIPGDINLAKGLYRHWCAKEAYVKAVGTGLVTELRRLEIRGLEGFDGSGRCTGISAWTLEEEGEREWRQDIKWKFDIERITVRGQEYYVCVCFNDSFAEGEGWKFLDWDVDVLQVIKSQ